MNIRQPVINSLNRVGIPYQEILDSEEEVAYVSNRFSGEMCKTKPLLAVCIDWIYNTNNAYERGDYSVKIADFDRIKYFVLDQDRKAYYTCLD